MAVKFTKTEAFNKAKADLAKTMTDGTPEQQFKAFEEFLSELHKEVSAEIANQVSIEQQDRSILQNRGGNVLTSAERNFFKAAIDNKGFDDDSILPVTTQDRIFEDIVKEHPLLAAIGLQDSGAVTRIIKSNPEGSAVWGALFGEIAGQIGSEFSEEKITQLKLTAFAIIPNDMLELGPEWVERYVRTLAVEAISVGLEKGFVLGSGKNEPIGLMKDLDAPVTGGVYADKQAKGELTFVPGRTTVVEMKNVIKGLSTVPGETPDKDKYRNVAGRVVMVVNPFDNYDIQASATTQNANGVYVTNLPFAPQIVESVFVPQGKVIFFVRGQYLAAVAGGYTLKKFDQTLAVEDATLYTIKQFATGKPLDNNATAVYDLAVEDLEVEAPAGA